MRAFFLNFMRQMTPFAHLGGDLNESKLNVYARARMNVRQLEFFNIAPHCLGSQAAQIYMSGQAAQTYLSGQAVQN